jgi:hypothetical protein
VVFYESLCFPSDGGRPFFYHEVIDQNDGAVRVNEYYPNGRVTEFRFCQKMTEGVRNFGILGGVYDPGWGMTLQCCFDVPTTAFLKAAILPIGFHRCSQTHPFPQLPSFMIGTPFIL